MTDLKRKQSSEASIEQLSPSKKRRNSSLKIIVYQCIPTPNDSTISTPTRASEAVLNYPQTALYQSATTYHPQHLQNKVFDLPSQLPHSAAALDHYGLPQVEQQHSEEELWDKHRLYTHWWQDARGYWWKAPEVFMNFREVNWCGSGFEAAGALKETPAQQAASVRMLDVRNVCDDEPCSPFTWSTTIV